MTSIVETWRPVANYEGVYEVSNLGRVRTLERRVKFCRGRTRVQKGKILSQKLSDKGYCYVEFWKNGHRKVKTVAHLVAEAFIGPRPQGLFVLHGPNGKIDNSVQNLSYGTAKENNYDRLRDGTLPLGEMHALSKLTEEKVRLIFYFYNLGWHKKNIAAMMNVTYQNVHAVLIGKTWKHIILQSSLE